MTGSSFYSVEKIEGRSGGTTQAETRIYNERLIVSLVRRNGQLSKADLTRLTALAPQTITTIVNRAAEEGLLVRCEPLRGRLGQPSVPYALNPAGAYAFGLNIDHRSADLAFVNFVGEVVELERTNFDYPDPKEVMAFAKTGVARMLRKHKAVPGTRIAGLGIASPFYQWNWNDQAEVPAGAVRTWQEVDIRAELDRLFDWPVYLFNDAMVAAGAELMFGAGMASATFLYAYLGYFIGGGLVLDHHLFAGRNNLAGALGNLQVPAPAGTGTTGARLLEVASLSALSQRLAGKDDGRVWSSPEDWGDLGPGLAAWIEDAAEGLAYAVQNAIALLDIDTVIVDGAMPVGVRKEVGKAMRRRLARSVAGRPEPFTVAEGSFGHLAPVIGGASIPLLVRYSNDKELLFKE